MTVEHLKDWVIKSLNKFPDCETEYFEIVDDEKLNEIKSWGENKHKIGCIAVKIGEVRLIDNIFFA
jgi:pantoate--beta-alanine ligase